MNARLDGMKGLLPGANQRRLEGWEQKLRDEQAQERRAGLAKRLSEESLARSAVEALMKGAPEADVYGWLIRLVEKPMLEVLARECRGNQSEMAKRLSLNRSTLRKRLRLHGVNR